MGIELMMRVPFGGLGVHERTTRYSVSKVYTFLQNLQLGSYEQYAQEDGAGF
jgi:hypothetical protein